MADNKLIASNPYGNLVHEELTKFEEVLQTGLPSEYRKYLVEHNGGDFERQIVSLPSKQGETRVHHMFGLHHGPDYRQLNRRYWQSKAFSPDHLPICDDGFGNIFYLKLRGEDRGSIYFADHESVSNSVNRLVRVAISFREFVEKMKSDEDVMDAFKRADPEGHAEFEKQLEKMRELRRRETGKLPTGTATKKGTKSRPKKP